ncbi:hypothetical protein N6H14_18405 [Paenibacillus sp. CC-CFT747]|nr:hypothetical protein N6H14_18405 [Paenibacillus sp. CC-CFT747]
MKNSDQEQFDELWKKALEESYRIEVPDPSASWAKVSLQLEKERRRRLGKRRVAMVAVTAASLLIGGTVFSVPVETNAYNPITKMLNNLKGDLVTFFNGVDEKNTSGAKTDSPPAEFEGQHGGRRSRKTSAQWTPLTGCSA